MLVFDFFVSLLNLVDEIIIGKKYLDVIIEVKKILKVYKDLEDVILIFGFDELDVDSKIIVKKVL